MTDRVTPEDGSWQSPPSEHDQLAHLVAVEIPALEAERDSLAAQLEAAQRKADEATQAHTSLTATYCKVARNSEQIEAELRAAQEVIEALRYIARAADDPLPATLREASEYASAALARYDAMRSES